jgi:thioredoxin 1
MSIDPLIDDWSLNMSEGILTLTDNDFEAEVLKTPELALVDFWAEWCAPCRALAPVIKGVADSYQGRLKVGKINVDENPNTAGRYQVRAIPTMLLFKNGEVVDQIVGLVSQSKLSDVINRHL